MGIKQNVGPVKSRVCVCGKTTTKKTLLFAGSSPLSKEKNFSHLTFSSCFFNSLNRSINQKMDGPVEVTKQLFVRPLRNDVTREEVQDHFSELHLLLKCV